MFNFLWFFTVADADYRAQLLPLPLTVKPSQAPQFEHFYRSDHYSFWDSDVPYSAVMLTDTAEFRGYMRRCYHQVCDNLGPVKDGDLEFLRRTINAVIQTTLELSEAGKFIVNHRMFKFISISWK